jgi:hypothetical protein
VTSPRPDPLAHLAIEVAQLQEQVAGLLKGAAGRAGEDGGTKTLRRTVLALAQGVTKLSERVDELAPKTPDVMAGAFWWPDLTAQAAEKAWGVLGSWVEDVIVERYHESIKPCWYRHPRAVDLLSAMRQAWAAAYRTDAPPTAAAEWHDRWLAHLWKLVDKETNGCTEREHRPDEMEPSVHDAAALRRFVEADVARRSSTTSDDEPPVGSERSEWVAVVAPAHPIEHQLDGVQPSLGAPGAAELD